MSTMLRADLELWLATYKKKIDANKSAAKNSQAIECIERLIEGRRGALNAQERDLGRLIKTYLPELNGKLGLEVAHGHFTVAVFLYLDGMEVHRAMKRARVEYGKAGGQLRAWIRNTETWKRMCTEAA